MPLSAGTKLGRYEIIELLGAGGIGEVYRARDYRLERSVALKILPSQISSDPQRLQRFEQEARAASALSHPNIIAVYELGQEGSTHYIAMELVEGRTVRELLNSGLLPIQKAIDIGAQIADGLTKAHEAGISHRDLKPENLMVSRDGFVKILDFGLAKLEDPKHEPEDRRITSEFLTPPGQVMGTIGYMSPEQISGDPSDFRSDQFSFGLVLYEMVTGRQPFKRATGAEALAAVLREQPSPVGAHNRDAPAPLCWAIDRCLAKDPGKRYASTRDLARELAVLRDSLSENRVRKAEHRATNLPIQRTRFVGRDNELSTARELLLRDDVCLVTITGPGGIGKTRLTIEIAGRLAEHFRGGVHFVPLSPLSDPALIASVIVQAIGIREAGGQSPLDILKTNLQDSSQGPRLLLLDNFEHLMKAAPIVAEMMGLAPNLKIMVTSRAPLHIYGEHEFPVPPLELPDWHSLPSVDELSKYPAVTLFVQRAVSAKPDFQLTAENARTILDICARLEGLPLAIELAAARVKVLSLSSLQARLESRLQLLTGGSRDLPERQQTLRAAIDWSYDLLNAEEQKLFRRLSVFVGGCTLEGVEAVCDAKEDIDLDLLDGVSSIVDKSLVQQGGHSNGEARFVMLETIREYGLEKLAVSSEDTLTRRAHAAYCLVLAEEEAAGKSSKEEAPLSETFAMEHDNFRAALEWLTNTRNSEWGMRLGAALFRFWETHEYLTEGRDRLGKLLALPEAAAPTKARARVLFAAGVLAGEQGDNESAEALTRESLNIARTLSDEQGVAVSLNALAVNARDRGDLDRARLLFAEGVERWRELGDQKGMARSLSNLASVVKLNGNFEGASAIYEECLTIFQGLGDRTGVAWSLNSQGDVARDQGNFAAAKALYEKALAIFQELDDRWGLAGTLADLGTLAREQRNCHAAESLYQQSLKIFCELEHKRGIARVLECFACAAASQSQSERSLRLAGSAAALRRDIGVPLSATERAKFEVILDSSRQALTNTATTMAWLEGWSAPIEKAVAEALTPEGAGSQI
ncbi:MAG: protein kinase domain-containing protein [Terriglobales bacterium]